MATSVVPGSRPGELPARGRVRCSRSAPLSRNGPVQAGTAARLTQIHGRAGLNLMPFSYDGQRIRRRAAGGLRGLEAVLGFVVLGSLRVEAGGVVVPVTSPRQRAVLAVLLVHANRSVSAAGLIGQVWGERCPASAGGLVHTYIWRLRRLFAAHEPAAGRPRITRQPGGYLLRAGEGELDACVFERLAIAGLDALAAGDAAGASGHLRRALGLWSGEALADLDLAGPAAAECGRLAELRRQAASARAEAGLALGQHAEAAAQLRA